MVTGKSPRLTIGLPVYNGERFVRFAIDSILNQTFRDFELIISDIGLPDGDGVELMSELRAAHPGLRGLALSGYGAETDISRSYAAGFQDHLTKPINVEALDRAMAKLLG